MPWVLLAGALLVAMAAWRRGRALVGSGLVVLLAVYTFEHGLHSAHHGLDPGEAERCVIASASAHVAGTTVDPITAIDLVAPPAETHDLAHRVPTPSIRCPRPAQERAPPA
jgi:hypothetical protein